MCSLLKNKEPDERDAHLVLPAGDVQGRHLRRARPLRKPTALHRAHRPHLQAAQLRYPPARLPSPELTLDLLITPGTTRYQRVLFFVCVCVRGHTATFDFVRGELCHAGG